MMMILGASVVVIATRKSRFADFFSNYALQLIIAPGCVDGDGMGWMDKFSAYNGVAAEAQRQQQQQQPRQNQ